MSYGEYRQYLREGGGVAQRPDVMLQAGRKAQTVQQPLSGLLQQAGFLVRGAHWGHLGATGADPLQVVEEGGVLLKAMAERPAEVECSLSAKT